MEPAPFRWAEPFREHLATTRCWGVSDSDLSLQRVALGLASGVGAVDVGPRECPRRTVWKS